MSRMASCLPVSPSKKRMHNPDAPSEQSFIIVITDTVQRETIGFFAHSQVISKHLLRLAQEDFSTATSAVQVLIFFFYSQTQLDLMIHKGLHWAEDTSGGGFQGENVYLFGMQLSHTVRVR